MYLNSVVNVVALFSVSACIYTMNVRCLIHHGFKVVPDISKVHCETSRDY